ncbi:Hypothetical protein CINCED_3A004712 [Cinara cedri]|uniref:Uncharacterized protein n=1 Tax=Cinara cedri TaxID=506608 RepID=A0A5E4M217_9HEMI|nr:Hypothetical protein CINCED_3A004712 [Cinara cedri]
MAANSAVMRAQNRAIAKGTDPKAATCRAKLQRARSALNRQMDRELRLREGAENLLRATTKDGGGGDSGGVGGVGRHKNKNRKLIRQTVALELSFLESNVRLLADELAELNGSVDVYQHRDDDDDDHDDDDDDDADADIKNYSGNVVSARTDGVTASSRGQRRRRQQMPMIAVPLKDTRPIDFGPPLERFIGQHYGVDLSATPGESVDGEGAFSDGESDGNCGIRRRRSLSLREAVDELTQLRLDTQTPSRDADGVRLLLRYYRQLYYVDRRFFPPSSTATLMTTASRHYHHNRQNQQQDYHYRHNNKQHQHAAVTDTAASSSFSSPPPAIYFEWYDSFGGPVPSCGQRTVRFEQACVLFNVAAVHTQMGAKHDRRCIGGIRDYDQETAGGARRSTGSLYTSTESETTDGATVAAQCFLRAAGAYRHIGDTFANAPARAADLRATGVLYAVMMAQAYECIFEKLQWRLSATIRHRCRLYHSGDETEEGGRRPQISIDSTVETSSQSGERRGRGVLEPTTRYRRTSAATTLSGGSGMNDVTTHTPSWTELAREAAHVSRMYAEVVYSSCIPDDSGPRGGKENGGIEQGSGGTVTVLPDVWVSVCRIKDRHYAALAYRYAACALLPYYRCSTDHRHHRRHRDRYADDETEADELLTELTTATAAVGLELTDDDETTSATVRQQRRCKQLGTLLLEAAAAAHDRAARAQRLCRQLRTKAEGNAAGGGGLLAGALDRERQRTVRLLLLHRRNDNEYDGTAGGGDDDTHCCCRRRRCSDDGPAVSATNSCHDCFSDDDGVDDTVAVDHCSGNGDQEEFTVTGIAGIPGLDVDRGVLFRRECCR